MADNEIKKELEGVKLKDEELENVSGGNDSANVGGKYIVDKTEEDYRYVPKQIY